MINPHSDCSYAHNAALNLRSPHCCTALSLDQQIPSQEISLKINLPGAIYGDGAARFAERGE
jgi:hypothetical protein